MNLPIDILTQLDDWLQQVDRNSTHTNRQNAIVEVAQLLVCITHEEHYNDTDSSDECYQKIVDTCRQYLDN